MSDEETVKAFMELGLSEQKATETLKNAVVTSTLKAILHEVRAVALPQGSGMLLYHLATKLKPQISHHMPVLAKYIVSKKLDNTLRVDKAVEFALSHIKAIDLNEFESFCGVGVLVTPEQIEKAVEQAITNNKQELLEKRYKFNTGLLMQNVRQNLPWADGKAVKNEIDLQVS